MFSPDTTDAFAHAMDQLIAYKNKWEFISTPRQQGKINQMGCRNFSDRMRELQRCGCPRCRDEFEDEYGRGRYYYDDYNRPSRALTYAAAPYITSDFGTKEIKVEPKIEEPKNYAVKLLVDQLKAQQGGLASKNAAITNDKAMIKTYQASLKVKNDEKLGIENKIKELAGALKKLGHKE